MEKVVIAFASNAPRVGKSETIKQMLQVFAEHSPVTHTIAYAIREILADVAKYLGKDAARYFEDYYLKDIETKYPEESIAFKTRDILCDFSFFIQKYYGVNIWGELAAENIQAYKSSLVFIDDLRRPDELNALKKHFGERLITVYLEKEDMVASEVLSNLSDSAKKFESKLVASEMDLQFTFNKDWSNTGQLAELLKSKLKDLDN